MRGVGGMVGERRQGWGSSVKGFPRQRGELSSRYLSVPVFGFGQSFSIRAPNPFHGRTSTSVTAAEGRMSSMHPALHRLECKGWGVSKWETAPERNPGGFKCKQVASAVAQVMWPAEENST